MIRIQLTIDIGRTESATAERDVELNALVERADPPQRDDDDRPIGFRA